MNLWTAKLSVSSLVGAWGDILYSALYIYALTFEFFSY